MNVYQGLVSRLVLGFARISREREIAHPPAKPVERHPGKPRIHWEEVAEADELLIEHYRTKGPALCAAMVAPYFPHFIVTKKMVIGRAYRLGLCKRAKTRKGVRAVTNPQRSK